MLVHPVETARRYRAACGPGRNVGEQKITPGCKGVGSPCRSHGRRCPAKAPYGPNRHAENLRPFHHHLRGEPFRHHPANHPGDGVAPILHRFQIALHGAVKKVGGDLLHPLIGGPPRLFYELGDLRIRFSHALQALFRPCEPFTFRLGDFSVQLLCGFGGFGRLFRVGLQNCGIEIVGNFFLVAELVVEVSDSFDNLRKLALEIVHPETVGIEHKVFLRSGPFFGQLFGRGFPA